MKKRLDEIEKAGIDSCLAKSSYKRIGQSFFTPNINTWGSIGCFFFYPKPKRRLIIWLQNFKPCHLPKLAIRAAMKGDYKSALGALVACPLTNDFDSSRDALNELLIAHKEYLPNFASTIAKIERGKRPSGDPAGGNLMATCVLRPPQRRCQYGQGAASDLPVAQHDW